MNDYITDVWWSEENNCYLAVAPDLPGCIADGETEQEVKDEINQSIKIWLEVNANRGYKNPVPIYRAKPTKIEDCHERINMLISLLMILTGMDENESQNVIKDTCVYDNISKNDEISLHEGFLINILDIISELKKKKIMNIESDKVYALCKWMSENDIHCSRQLRENSMTQKEIENSIQSVVAVEPQKEKESVITDNDYRWERY